MGRSILPTLKEKKRYMELTTLKGNIDEKEIKESLINYLGLLGYSKGGIFFPKNDILRCNSSSLTDVKAGLSFSKQQIIIKNVSGNIGRVK